MATGNSVHDEVKEQQQKLKGKPFKEKWAYFWEYYKIQTLVIIAVLAFAPLSSRTASEQTSPESR